MIIDIMEGDLLLIKGVSKEYPIRRCDFWDDEKVNLIGMDLLLTKIATTKRAPSLESGKRGDPEPWLPEFECTPLDPVTPEVQKQIVLDAPIKLLGTFVPYESGFVYVVVEDIKSK